MPYMMVRDIYADEKVRKNLTNDIQSEGQSFMDGLYEKTDVNRNIMVIGGPGSGKNVYFLRPRIAEAEGETLVVADMNCSLVNRCREELEEKGYTIKVIDLCNLEESAHFNPLRYVHNEDDEELISNIVIRSIAGVDDDFLYSEEKSLLTAAIHVVKHSYPLEEQNFTSVINLLSDASENGSAILKDAVAKAGGGRNDWYKFFEENVIPMKEEEFYEISLYLLARLQIFKIKDVACVMNDDTLGLEKLGLPDDRTALFIEYSMTNTVFNMLNRIVINQAYREIFKTHIDKQLRSNELHPVRFFLDGFPIFGDYQEFTRILNAQNLNNMGTVIMANTLTQLEESLQQSFEPLAEFCDTVICFAPFRDEHSVELFIRTYGENMIDRSEMKRAIKRINDDEVIIHISGHGTYVVNQEELFKEQSWKKDFKK